MPAQRPTQPRPHPADGAPREFTTPALQALAAAGLRKTSARCRVMARLLSADAPQSVQDLQPFLTDLHLDPVTIYRILHVLVDRGLLRQVDLGDRTYRFERVTVAPMHAHFVCRTCGRAWCLDEQIRGLKRGQLEHQLGKGFVLEARQLLYQGLCAHCTRTSRRVIKGRPRS